MRSRLTHRLPRAPARARGRGQDGLHRTFTGLRGHRVAVARSGLEGLIVALATRPEVILLDIGLPDLDGFEVASRLRATGEFDGVLIIAITGYGTESDRRRSSAAGID